MIPMRSRVIAITGLFATIPVITMSAEPISIGSRLEPLLDAFLIERMDGAALKLHSPVPREVAIVHDAPWEGNVSTYHTIFRDGDRYRMYYRGQHYGKRPGAEKSEHQKEVVCYAESNDGIHWTKPELDIVEFAGSRENNIIWDGPGRHNFAPFKDANPDCKPEERYKAIGSDNGLIPFASADGIHWKRMQEKRLPIAGVHDSLNLAFWDSHRRMYVAYVRDFRNDIRDIRRSTSPDFLNWTGDVWLDYGDAPVEHLYTNAIQPYDRAPHILVGFPMRHIILNNPPREVADAVFMSSRDGLKFRRWTEAFIRPGLQRERWVNRNNMPARGIVETKSDLHGSPELSIYATENYYGTGACRLRRHTLRLDGFVSVNAPLKGGMLLTKPIRFDGSELVLNLSTSAAGSARVEIQDEAGKPIPDFALAECSTIIGDEIERVVHWSKGKSVKALAGRTIRLRIELKDADLYSLRFR